MAPFIRKRIDLAKKHLLTIPKLKEKSLERRKAYYVKDLCKNFRETYCTSPTSTWHLRFHVGYLMFDDEWLFICECSNIDNEVNTYHHGSWASSCFFPSRHIFSSASQPYFIGLRSSQDLRSNFCSCK